MRAEEDPGSMAHFGRVITGDTYLACSGTREMFFEQFKADAVEMKVRQSHKYVATGMSFVIVRVLSDLAGDESHIDFDQFVDESSQKAARILNKVLPVLDVWE